MIERETVRDLLAGFIIAWIAYLFGRANGTRVVYVITTIEPLEMPEVVEPVREVAEPVTSDAAPVESLADSRD